ncbi:MAG: FGGY-family carbohydrate kinase [Defluviitaleaceae bacterium]|nr:FGGY-family carbohydrate kinase [Defluviitaleaceae bacterium]
MEHYLGIELGSTRIKAVLIDENFVPVASGEHSWENRLENGVWTYREDDIWAGLRDSFAKLRADFKKNFGTSLTTVAAMGVSAMMHGYMAFNAADELLIPFRTWRNTSTEEAAARLTALLDFNIPQRWSIAHLYQAALNNESHISEISFMTTLAGYVHWRLTGEKVLGVGDASGMFPVENGDYNAEMSRKFAGVFDKFKIEDIFPKVLNAGENAGKLTDAGAKLLDPSGEFLSGVLMCPPEGDAGTGMVATNSITERTGNVSAGTSVFAMIVLEKNLSKTYTEVDIVTTPAGKPVAMVHCNNCTSDLDAWVNLFGDALGLFGKTSVGKVELYEKLYNAALCADSDGGGLLAYNYFSGEPIAGLDEGRPLFARLPNAKFTVPNLMRTLLFSALATLRLGMDILAEENIALERLLGHGGFFKTAGVGQKMMAAALDVPVYVAESAGEGGAWGIALLAAYRARTKRGADTDRAKRGVEAGDTCDERHIPSNRARRGADTNSSSERSERFPLHGDTCEEQHIPSKPNGLHVSLEDFLAQEVFAGTQPVCETPNPVDVSGFNTFLRRYKQGFAIEKSAVENFLS